MLFLRKGFSLRLQLMMMIFLILSGALITTFIIAYEQAKQQVIDVGGEMFSNVLKDSVGFMDAMNERVIAGDLTLEEAQEIARTYILGPKQADGTRDISKTKMSTNDYMYVWAANPDNVFTMHSFDVEGHDLSDYNINGKYTVKDSWANKEKIGHVFEELWQNEGEPVYTFIAYQDYYAPWDWVVGAGGRKEIIYKNRLAGMKHMFMIASAAALVISLGIAYFFANKIANKMAQINVAIGKASTGDFTETVQITYKDEFGQLSDNFNKMTDDLKSMINQVTLTTNSVASAAEELTANTESVSVATKQIAETAQTVASGADNQARSIGESSRTMDEISSSIQHVASNTEEMANAAVDTTTLAETGDEVVNKAVRQMDSITATVHTTESAIVELGNRSNEIGEIVNVITQIASQTNLLALNAAIEASRAGEHGRGFAVVADEVRKLAEQSSASALQITELISHIQNETNFVVQKMKTSTSEVANGMELVKRAGEMFEQIKEAANVVAAQAQDVSASVEEVTAGVEQIVVAADTLHEIAHTSSEGAQGMSAATEEQLASMEEISSSAASLEKMAEELQLFMNKFKI
ncbi:methyl-accepting chemotaxis protein [Bacillus chungangensis]|uniref:Methyl-accepting chemotaxis protein n=1 Tax=Bacillus chungangensis TaxID=587633 RepID=A0ABT9WQ01_9BACI|nr:methyl-accepting chemotaxis protein [Bacillus chungangensis]MDQ0175280.1 methyl-accepting chemotaxis protein [Bacillus chungangensis]